MTVGGESRWPNQPRGGEEPAPNPKSNDSHRPARDVDGVLMSDDSDDEIANVIEAQYNQSCARKDEAPIGKEYVGSVSMDTPDLKGTASAAAMSDIPIDYADDSTHDNGRDGAAPS